VISRRTIAAFVIALILGIVVGPTAWKDGQPCRNWRKTHRDENMVGRLEIEGVGLSPCQMMMPHRPVWFPLVGIAWLISITYVARYVLVDIFKYRNRRKLAEQEKLFGEFER
jgi:hypothetical protein